MRTTAPLLPEFPEISKLAYIDEGVVRLRPRELHVEWVQVVATLREEATRKPIETLQNASECAMVDQSKEVVVLHSLGKYDRGCDC